MNFYFQVEAYMGALPASERPIAGSEGAVKRAKALEHLVSPNRCFRAKTLRLPATFVMDQPSPVPLPCFCASSLLAPGPSPVPIPIHATPQMYGGVREWIEEWG